MKSLFLDALYRKYTFRGIINRFRRIINGFKRIINGFRRIIDGFRTLEFWGASPPILFFIAREHCRARYTTF